MRSLVILCVLLAAPSALAGSVRGTVYLEDSSTDRRKVPKGLPVSVELRSQVGLPRFEEVRDGEFAFGDVPPGGGYEVVVHPPEGLDSYPVHNICVTTGVTEVELNLRLHVFYERICVPCRSSLNGRVVNADGNPAGKLPVRLVVRGREIASTYTNRRGRFRFEAVTELEDVTIEVVLEKLPLQRFTLRRSPQRIEAPEYAFTLSDCPFPASQLNSGAAPDPKRAPQCVEGS